MRFKLYGNVALRSRKVNGLILTTLKLMLIYKMNFQKSADFTRQVLLQRHTRRRNANSCLTCVRNSYGEQAFGNIEMNMAAYVGKDSEPQKIEFPDSFFKDTYINVEWTIQLDESARSSTITASTTNVATKTFT